MKNGTLLPQLFGDVSRLFDVAADFPLPHTPELRSGVGACDIEETPTHFMMHFDIPGVKKEDVHIEVHGRDLRVSGERKREISEDQRSYFLQERGWGRFERRFHLGEDANVDSIEARFDNGVLTVRVAKKEALQPRQIEIK